MRERPGGQCHLPSTAALAVLLVYCCSALPRHPHRPVSWSTRLRRARCRPVRRRLVGPRVAIRYRVPWPARCGRARHRQLGGGVTSWREFRDRFGRCHERADGLRATGLLMPNSNQSVYADLGVTAANRPGVPFAASTAGSRSGARPSTAPQVTAPSGAKRPIVSRSAWAAR
jgi:hypothetical protein